ncbi:TPA: hypothetical protein CPT80_04130 [Candidatus Gastranaerophilales bacterium HUM_9]|nr:MAG TPA: hypothetical protein CPT80_04130 [Candidatus Gastranaerophilales bacterium HUM_9]HBX34175.1 hypothetical protein [Cyanobacteria bacterium UBA11440]
MLTSVIKFHYYKIMFKTRLKIFISLSICVSMLMAPSIVLADTVYDFSDEAQARFEQSEQVLKGRTEIKTEPQVEQSKKRTKKTKIDSVQTNVPTQTNIVTPSQKIIQGGVVCIKEGQSFDVALQSSISSGSLGNRDTIASTLIDDWVYNQKLIAPRGSVVYGRALDTKKAGMFFADGTMSITFDSILLPNGEQLPLTANVVKIKTKATNRVVKSTIRVVSGALVGVATGLLYALAFNGDMSRGAVVGASLGAAGGLVSAATSRGENVEIPAGTVINVRLTKPMNANVYSDKN